MWITKMKTTVRSTETLSVVRRIPFIFRPFIKILGFVSMNKETV